MGSVYAGLMASAGHEVFAITKGPAHAEAMARGGLRLEGFSGDRTVRLHAGVSTEGVDPVDLVVIATKTVDAEDAARAALPLLGSETPVQTMQNGLGSGERVAAIVGADRTIVGVGAGFGASIVAPGHVHHNGMDRVHFGAHANLPPAALEAAAEIWRSAGFTVELHADTERLVWRKLLVNITVSAACCLAGHNLGQLMSDEALWLVAQGALLEAVATALAKGVDLEVGDPVQHVTNIISKVPDARPSMLMDHMAKRRSEIDDINGAVVREAARLGVPAPINGALAALVKAREAHFA
jgi:2-dehydropantoate 2-reductase